MRNGEKVEYFRKLQLNSKRSSRAMARTGLRMMPTSPSPPLKFRTVSFPQYGSKISMSDSAFLSRNLVKPAPGIPSLPLSLPPSFAHVHFRQLPGTASSPPLRPYAAVRETNASLPQGSLAPVRVMLSRSIIAYCDPIRQSRRHAAISYYLIRNAFAVRERLGIPRDFS
jgi:hypothetical protein